MKRVAWMVCVLMGGFAVGCASPCETLATAVCERAGATSTACVEASRAAENAREEEQRACSRVSAITTTLSKNR